MILFFYFLSSLLLVPIASLYLNSNQWNSIQKLLQNKKTTPIMKYKINSILFKAYQKFAIGQALSFKKIHKQKCNNIKKEDLILSSQIGLFKSIKKYKGSTNFENYSKIYIQGELYKCLTDFHNLTLIPKSIRKKNKLNLTWVERRKYNKLLKTSFVDKNNEWRFDKITSKWKTDSIMEEKRMVEKTQELWEIINQYFDSCIKNKKNKRIFLLKFDSEFNVIRSNLEISKQMGGCSEENIRQILQRIKKELNLFLKDFFSKQENYNILAN